MVEGYHSFVTCNLYDCVTTTCNSRSVAVVNPGIGTPQKFGESDIGAAFLCLILTLPDGGVILLGKGLEPGSRSNI